MDNEWAQGVIEKQHQKGDSNRCDETWEDSQGKDTHTHPEYGRGGDRIRT